MQDSSSKSLAKQFTENISQKNALKEIMDPIVKYGCCISTLKDYKLDP